jgi:hypothetical protein
MSNTVKISFHLEPSEPDVALGFEAWVDDNKLFDTDHVQVAQDISVEIDDTDADHKLKFVMKNKTPAHTQHDAKGELIKDASLKVTKVAFDEIELGHMLTELSVYEHDFNGSRSLTQEKFYSIMGCNGTVTLDFSTPMYMWLLENM